MRLIRCHHSLWQHFRAFHYSPEVFNKSARCYLVEVSGKWVGFVASLPLRSGTLKNSWRAHKTAVLRPMDHAKQKGLWARVADAQAQHHISHGHRFFSAAPIDHASYREVAGSGWKPTTKNERRKLKRGECSHEFIGTKEAA